MSIYTPYTYLIGWSTHDKWYYGARWAKSCNPTDLWSTYFTSSKYVKDYRDIFGEPDVIEIRKVFSNGEACRLHESKVLKRINAVTRSDFLNRTDNKGFNPKFWKEWWESLDVNERQKRQKNWEAAGRAGVIKRFQKMEREEKTKATENARNSLARKRETMTEKEKQVVNAKISKAQQKFWNDENISKESRKIISDKSKKSWLSKSEEEKESIKSKLSKSAIAHRQSLSCEEKSNRAKKSKENTPTVTCFVCGSTQMKHHINRFHNENCKKKP